MDGNNKLSRINDNDNNTRLMFAVIGLLVVLIAALCLYIFVFDKDTPDETSAEISKEAQSSAPTPEHSEEASENIGEESTVTDTSKEESTAEVSEEASVSDISEEPSEAEVSEEPSEPDNDPEHGWVINNLGYTYLYNGKGYEQFTYSSAIAEKYATSLGNIASKCGNANIYHILVPTNCEFADIPRAVKQEDDFYCSSQQNFTEKVNSLTESKIVNVNVYDKISSRVSNGEYIYYATDPNYTCLGAYTVYSEFCKAAGLSAVSESTYSLKVLSDTFLGRFYTATGSERLKKNADSLYYYDVDDAYKASEKVYRRSGIVNREGVIFTDVPSYAYYCYLGEDARMIDVATSAGTGKNLLVIGDSSASPVVTLLVPHYDNITFVNSTLQTDDITDVIANGKFDDVLIINYNTNAGRLIYKNINSMAGAANE